ncbi:MAG: GNAT family N-acetyltransferase [Lentisphaeria bacterium]|nr:GNAT family N-acetyltransferase [Lentisphaeria bacterium]
MTPDDRAKFSDYTAGLRDGRTVTLRFLSTADGESLGRFYEALPAASRRFYWPHELDFEHGLIRASRADQPFEVCLVAETSEGGIGGYAWYRWPSEDAESSGFGIAVAEEWQSSGVGRTLMTRLLEISETVGPPKMHLTCQHANFRAVRLYQKLGFQITREGMCRSRRGFGAEPNYWMERQCR